MAHRWSDTFYERKLNENDLINCLGFKEPFGRLGLRKQIAANSECKIWGLCQLSLLKINWVEIYCEMRLVKWPENCLSRMSARVDMTGCSFCRIRRSSRSRKWMSMSWSMQGKILSTMSLLRFKYLYIPSTNICGMKKRTMIERKKCLFYLKGLHLILCVLLTHWSPWHSRALLFGGNFIHEMHTSCICTT